MAQIIRWGVIGPGRIAQSFAQSLALARGCELVAVASREQQRADAFAQQYGVPRAYGSYQSLYADPEVDAVYVATPHNHHRDCVIDALRAGKHVLCEKPMGVNEADVRAMTAAAQQSGRFLMEAMWTRYLPAIVQAKTWVAEGLIGEPRLVDASFAWNGTVNPNSRLYDPNLAGGGLLDVGVYPLSLACYFLGEPVDATGVAVVGETGVDELASFAVRFAQGGVAALQCGMRVGTGDHAWVYGTQGKIYLEQFWTCKRATLYQDGQEPQVFEAPFGAKGFQFEIEAAGEHIRAGDTQAALMPLAETLAITRVMDALRKRWGVIYPFEKA